MSNQLKLTEFLKKRTRDERDSPSEEYLTEKQDTSPEQSIPDCKKRKYDHTFQKNWLGTYPWLRKTDSGMICALCSEYGKINTFTRGCKNYRSSTLTRHVSCQDHCDSVRDSVLRNSMATATNEALKRSDTPLTAAMRSTYWMAKEDIPINKYTSVLELQKLNGCVMLQNLSISNNATYSSRATGIELQECIAETIHHSTIEAIRKAEMFSVLIDESTDISVSKQMVAYVRIANENFEPKTYFLKNMTIDSPKSDAEVLFNLVMDLINTEQLDVTKLRGFGSDGAAVMVGKRNGVAAKLKQKSPHLVSIHCMAHRFNLCTSQASKNNPHFKDFEQTLSDLYYYFGGSKSGNRACELAEIQKVLNNKKVKIKECHEIRWLAFSEAVFAVYRSWPSLITYYKKHDDRKCKDFLHKLSEYKFLFILYTLMDILPSVSQMSLLLQKQDIDIAAVGPALSNLKTKIKQAQKGNGHYQSELLQQLVFKKDTDGHVLECSFKGQKLIQIKDQKKVLDEIRDTFCEKLSNNITERFPKDAVDVSTAFHVFGMRSLSFLSDIEKEQYGNKELEIIINHYGSDAVIGDVKSSKLIDGDSCRTEWSLAKHIVVQQMYPRDSTKLLWQLLYKHHRESLPNLIILANICLILPYQTADCERGFSCQNGIKTNRRNRMQEKTMNTLMTIKIDGSPIEKADFSEAMKLYKSKKDRKISKT